jgi:hypothetical protein
MSISIETWHSFCPWGIIPYDHGFNFSWFEPNITDRSQRNSSHRWCDRDRIYLQQYFTNDTVISHPPAMVMLGKEGVV